MARDFQITTTASTCGTVAGCSGATVANTPVGRLAVDGGSSSATTATATHTVRNNAIACLMFELAPADTSWPAGNWTVNLNVTTGNTDFTWIATYVCRFNSSCVNQATVGSLTGQSTSMTAGSKSMTVSGSSQTAASDDKVYIVCVFDIGGSHGDTSFSIDHTTVINTPLGVTQSCSGTINAAGSTNNAVLTRIRDCAGTINAVSLTNDAVLNVGAAATRRIMMIT
jgi:hypothetical protein